MAKKPNYNFEKVVDGLGMFTKETKAGNTIIYNRYRVNKN